MANGKVLRFTGEFNAQQIIQNASQAKKYLEDMLPEGTQLADLEKKLNRVVQDATTASARIQQGFSSNSEVKEFERLIESIDRRISELGIEISNIPLDRMKLPLELQQQFDKLEQKTTKTKAAMKSMFTELQQAAVKNKSSMGIQFLSDSEIKELISARNDTRALEEIINRISANGIDLKLEDEQARLEQLNKQLDGLLRKQAEANVARTAGSREDYSGEQREVYDQLVAEELERMRGTDGGASAMAGNKEYKAVADNIDKVTQRVENLNQQKGKLEEFGKVLRGEGTDSKMIDTMGDLVNKTNDAEREYHEAKQAEDAFVNSAGVEGKKAGFDKLNQSINSLGGNSQKAKAGIQQMTDQFARFNQQAQALDSFKSRLQYVLSFTNAFYTLRTVLIKAKQAILDLDKAFNEIAVVTNFTNEQLWQSFDRYNEMAQKLGVTTTDAIKTSALYYQQGLETAEVMRLTEETIKMASIAGMDFAEATDRMTAAIRGFKLEMEDASRVNDVFSALAAASAVDTDELSQALTKTASIAASAGMELETTSALLSLMIESTREAPENLGTAMKTVVARFQEMKKAVGEIEVEGEVVDVNKVETALRSVGISLRDELTGQFRDLDDVFLELSSIWDTLDRNTQRYVATIAAGSRQQSRFIAMVDNYARATELVDIAQNSAGASAAQFDKRVQSLENRINKITAGFEELIGSIANETSLASKVVDLAGNAMQVLNSLNEGGTAKFLVMAGALFLTIKNIVNTVTNGAQGVLSLINMIQMKIATPQKFTLDANDEDINNQIQQLRDAAQQGAMFEVDIIVQNEEQLRDIERRCEGLRNVNIHIRDDTGAGIGDGVAGTTEVPGIKTPKSNNSNKKASQKNSATPQATALVSGLSSAAQAAGALASSFITLSAATESAVKAQGTMTGQMIGQGVGSAASAIGMGLMAAHPIIGAIVSIAGAVLSPLITWAGGQIAVLEDEKKYGIGSESNRKKLEEEKMEATEKLSKTQEENKNLYDLGTEYENLAGKVNLTVEEKQRLSEITLALQTEYGDLNGALRDEANAYKNNIALIQEYIDKKKLSELQAKSETELTTFASEYAEASKEITDKLQNEKYSFLKLSNDSAGIYTEFDKFSEEELSELIKKHGDLQKAIAYYQNTAKYYSNKGAREYEEGSPERRKSLTLAEVYMTKAEALTKIAEDYDELYSEILQKQKEISKNVAEISFLNLKHSKDNNISDWVLEQSSLLQDMVLATDEGQTVMETFLQAMEDANSEKDKTKAEAMRAEARANFQAEYDAILKDKAEFLNKYKEEDLKYIQAAYGLSNVIGEEAAQALLVDALKISEESAQELFSKVTKDYIKNAGKAYGKISSYVSELSKDFFKKIGLQNATQFLNIATILSDESEFIQKQYAKTFQEIVDAPLDQLDNSIKEKFYEIFSKVDPTNAISVSNFINELEDEIPNMGKEIGEKFWIAFSGVDQTGLDVESTLERFENKMEKIADYSDIISDNLESGLSAKQFAEALKFLTATENYDPSKWNISMSNGKIKIGDAELLNEAIEKTVEQEKESLEYLIASLTARRDAANIAYEQDKTEANLLAKKEAEQALAIETANYMYSTLDVMTEQNKLLKERLKTYGSILKEIDRYYNYEQKISVIDHQSNIAEIKYDINDPNDGDSQYDSVQTQYDNLFLEESLRKSLQSQLSGELANARDFISTNYGEFWSYDESGAQIKNYDAFLTLAEKIKNTTDEDERAYLKEQYDDIEAIGEAYDEVYKNMQDNEEKLADLTKAQKEFREEQQKIVGDTLDKIAEAINKQEKQEIDAIKEKYNAIKKEDKEYLDSVKKNIEKERKLRDEADQKKEIQDIADRIALLSRDTSGVYAAEIAQLQEEQANMLQDYADDQVDKKLEEMQEDMNEKHEGLDREVEFLEERRKLREKDWEYYKQRAKDLWDAYLADSKTGLSPILELLKSTDSEFLKSSEENQKLIIQDWETELANAKAASVLLGTESTTQGEIAVGAYNGVNDVLALWMANIQAINDLTVTVNVDDTAVQDLVKSLEKAISLATVMQIYNEEIAAKTEVEKYKQQLIDEGYSKEEVESMVKKSSQYKNWETAVGNTDKAWYTHATNMGYGEGTSSREKNKFFNGASRDIDFSNYEVTSESEQLEIAKSNGSVTETNNGFWKILLKPSINAKSINQEGSSEFGTGEYRLGIHMMDNFMDPNNPYYEVVRVDNNEKYWVESRHITASSVSPRADVKVTHGAYLMQYNDGDFKYYPYNSPSWRGRSNPHNTPKYAKGGLVDFTGPAWVDGTKSKPEAFLSAADTKLFATLRDNLSYYSKFNKAERLPHNSNYENHGVTNYDVHINVDSIANDYDVEQLWNQLQRKIVQSSKTITRATRKR